jgi:integrase
MTSTWPLARNTNHSSDSDRDRGAGEGCVRPSPAGGGSARGSSDELAAGGVDAIGLMLSGRSVRVQQNPLLLLLPSSLGRGCPRLRCALSLARVMERASAIPQPRTWVEERISPPPTRLRTPRMQVSPRWPSAAGRESRSHGTAHTTRAIWRTSFAPPGARPRQRAVRRSLCAGRRGAGSARRRRSATLGPRTQRAAGGDPVALPLRRDPAPRTHSHHRASPTRRHDRAIVSYLDEPETGALLAASDERRWIGRHDHALMTFTIQTGPRVSELIALRWQGAHLAGAPHFQATGKRRKQRITPLTTHTTDVLRCWTKERAGGPEQPLFPTSRGRRSAATPSPYWSANTPRPRPAAARRWPPRRSHRTCCATPPPPVR